MDDTDWLQAGLDRVPSYEKWDDDDEWEAVVFFEMIRNFGVSRRDVTSILGRLLRQEPTSKIVGGFLAKLTDEEKVSLRDAVEAVGHAQLEEVQVAKKVGANFNYRATNGEVRFTFNYRPQALRQRVPEGEPPYPFMIDIVARRKVAPDR